MPERYSYPIDLPARLAAGRSHRRILFGALFLAALACASVAAWMHLGGRADFWFCLPVPFALLLASEELKFRRLQGQFRSFLEVEHAWLRQMAPDGRVLVEINLGEHFEVRPAHVRGLPMLRVCQGRRRLEFCTLIGNGRSLVEDVLGKPWLPDFESHVN